MSKAWPLVAIGSVAKPIERLESPLSGKTYRQIGVRLWGQGAYERESIDGSETKYKTLNRVKNGDIIVNKIWARNGSVSVVSNELEGCYCSGEFPIFEPMLTQLEPKWFYWITKTHWFWEKCDAQSRGTSGKNRIRPEKFMAISIPLPPLAEQQWIVEKIERLAGKIEEARELRRIVTTESAFFSKSAYRKTIGNSPKKDWVSLQEMIVDIENGWSPACQKNPAENASWGVLKVGAVSFGYFDPKENKELPPTLQPKPQYEIKPGDFLMSRANTTNLVGACALVRDTPSRLMLCDKIFRFIFHKDNRLNPTYLDYVLKSPALRMQIEVGATGTSPTMKNIAKAKVMQLRIPAPAIQDQVRIVKYLDSLKGKVDHLKTIQSQTAAELDALLPSILDKAFKGEL